MMARFNSSEFAQGVDPTTPIFSFWGTCGCEVLEAGGLSMHAGRFAA